MTGTRERRGYGFDEVQDQAERAGKATLLIRSGSGRGQIAILGEQRRRAFATARPAFPGTLVQLLLEPV